MIGTFWGAQKMLECILIPMYRSFFDGDGLAKHTSDGLAKHTNLFQKSENYWNKLEQFH